ncbi:sensor domain-containing diguanylate cyclase [Pseudomonas sp. GD03842]|uniref:sensor domain-containing diguanylate cyclase n=1 Tax=Pseudomonas sp. GD03842 TaxID=2975385 RepID=UPI00244D0110|nr:sensor domain-containing diguanylate cyclase [Pseudomonas sp. GD03842]MDH0748787.1 sensor domain-containing diguanylate cyclase [Pseudomonas sp. GD03842]
MPSGRRASAVFRMTLTFMLLMVASFLAVEGWRSWRDYRHAYVTAEDSAKNLARATAQHAEDAIRQVDVLTAELRERVEGDGLQNIDIPRIRALLDQQTRIMPQLQGLFIYAPNGDWIVTNQYITPETANNSDRAYFNYHRTHLGRDIRIGEVVRSRSSRELVIPVSRRLDRPDGSFGGVLLGTLKVSYFLDFYGDFKIDDKGALVLALRSGEVLVRRPFISPATEQSLARSEIFTRYLPQSSEGVAEVRAVIDNTRRLYAYRALTSYPLVVEAGLSRESFIGPWRHDLFKTAMVLLVLMGFLASFGAIVLAQLRARFRLEREIRVAHQTLQDMALTDSLTGLGNRRKLDMVLEQEIERARRQGEPLALIMLDVDYFKRFNDRYGHPAGDTCLQQVAQAIRGTLKRPADLAVRYGGEEFTVLLPGTDATGAGQVAEDMIQRVRALNIDHADHPLGIVTASAGVAAVTPAKEPTNAAGMIKSADAFLYMAKHSGRNRWCSDETLHKGNAETPLPAKAKLASEPD